ncbi:hypothetical protein B4U84_26355 [Westiellopsis prolifica IICB1]|nr:hypothetical protein B4U84_26355 [Westiellopsis prolifica IICB1]
MELQNATNTQVSVNLEDNVKEQNQKKLQAEEIVNWLISYIANLLDTDQNKIDTQSAFERYGLDSAATVSLISDLENWLGYELEATLLYDYPTIHDLGQHLSERFNNLSSTLENV